MNIEKPTNTDLDNSQESNPVNTKEEISPRSAQIIEGIIAANPDSAEKLGEIKESLEREYKKIEVEDLKQPGGVLSAFAKQRKGIVMAATLAFFAALPVEQTEGEQSAINTSATDVMKPLWKSAYSAIPYEDENIWWKNLPSAKGRFVAESMHTLYGEKSAAITAPRPNTETAYETFKDVTLGNLEKMFHDKNLGENELTPKRIDLDQWKNLQRMIKKMEHKIPYSHSDTLDSYTDKYIEAMGDNIDTSE